MLARINTDIALANFEIERAESRQRRGDGLLGVVLPVPEPRRGDRGPRQRPGHVAENLHAFTPTAARAARRKKRPRPASQYFLFRSTAEQSLNSLYATEAKLRYLLGLAATDGRLIRPKDEPTTAKVAFDWYEVLSEGLARSVELREEKWIVKRRELELIAAKNFLLPRVDFVGQYRWLGMGNRLDGANSLDLDDMQHRQDSNAYRTLMTASIRNGRWDSRGRSTWDSAARWRACGMPNWR